MLTALRATMPDLGADPRRQSRVLTSLLPVTAPLFFIVVERVLPTVVTPAVRGGIAISFLTREADFFLNKKAARCAFNQQRRLLSKR